MNHKISFQRGSRNSRNKSIYKHVPHADKPVHVVEKRNARERRRVHAVNLAFARLGKTIPFENKACGISPDPSRF